MKAYNVIWQMEFDAESAEDAARQALTVQRDPESIATVFDVMEIDNGAGEFSVFNVSETIDITALDAAEEADYLNDPRQ
jgi:hypothetical protein